jgi:hypothetical protein
MINKINDENKRRTLHIYYNVKYIVEIIFFICFKRNKTIKASLLKQLRSRL